MPKKVLFQLALEDTENGDGKLHIFIEKSVPPPVMCNHLAKAIQMVCGSSILEDIEKIKAKPNIWLPDKNIKIQ